VHGLCMQHRVNSSPICRSQSCGGRHDRLATVAWMLDRPQSVYICLCAPVHVSLYYPCLFLSVSRPSFITSSSWWSRPRVVLRVVQAKNISDARKRLEQEQLVRAAAMEQLARSYTVKLDGTNTLFSLVNGRAMCLSVHI
jgi:hypothetical protein